MSAEDTMQYENAGRAATTDNQSAAPHDGLPAYADAPASLNFRKLRKRLLRQTQAAIADFGMDAKRADGAAQKWLVCLSGGKDSYGLLALLLDLKWQSALKAELLVCNLDQGQPGFPKHVLPAYLDRLGVDYRIITEDTASPSS
jgi:tRNA 2-thiocytidine biosynthesis protein TtcA